MFARPGTHLAMAFLLFLPSSALALIEGARATRRSTTRAGQKGRRRSSITRARIAWWEGPPFGGGQWHAEFRGEAKTLNAMLEGLAKLDVKTKRIVVHDGVGASFWLNINREASKKAIARMDWAFTVWQADRVGTTAKAARRPQSHQSGRRGEGPPYPD